MKNLISTTFLLILCMSLQTATAQSPYWSPVPYSQTNLYSSDASNQLIPMQCDYWQPGGIGDFYGIYEQFIQDEFDTCANTIWDPAFVSSYPKADYRMYVQQPGDIIWIYGGEYTFQLPLNLSSGDWSHFGNGLIIKAGNFSMKSILGTTDSVRAFTVYLADSITEIGTLELSKQFGFTEYTTIRSFENHTVGSMETWTLAGTKGDLNTAGINLPGRIDYLPYQVGDDLVFYHSYYADLTTKVVEYHHLNIEEVVSDSGASRISGVCLKYTDQGIYIETDSHYVVDFEPVLSELVDRVHSVRHISGTGQGLFGYMRFYDTVDSALVAKSEAISFSYCDTTVYVDGPSRTEYYSTKYGLLKQLDHGFPPPTLLELYAADAQGFSYGTWPNWLSTPQLAADAGVNIYPNPGMGQCWIEPGNQNSYRIELTDMAGTSVLTRTIRGRTSLDLTALSAGIYLVHCTSATTRSVRRLVVE